MRTVTVDASDLEELVRHVFQDDNEEWHVAQALTGRIPLPRRERYDLPATSWGPWDDCCDCLCHCEGPGQPAPKVLVASYRHFRAAWRRGERRGKRARLAEARALAPCGGEDCDPADPHRAR